MTQLQSIFTDKGLEKSQNARINGWYINITGFGCSEFTGLYQSDRDFFTLNPMWCNLPVSGRSIISPQTQQLNLVIPPNVLNPNNTPITVNKNINELYLFAETQGSQFTVDILNNELILNDNNLYSNIETGLPIRFRTTGTLPLGTPENLQQNKTFFCIKTGTANRIKVATSNSNALGNIFIDLATLGTGIHTVTEYFLFCLAQFTPEPLLYVYTGSTTLRCQLTITNFNTTDGLKFLYTQSTEIESHNLDPNAHPEIQSALEYNGVYVNNANFTYKGQNLIKGANIDSSVTNDCIVYKKASDSKFYKAIATTGEPTKWIGIKQTDGSIRTGGIIKISIPSVISTPINADLYLSNNTDGEFTTNITGYRVGVHLGNGLVEIQKGGIGSNVNFLNDLADVINVAPQNRHILIHNGTSYNNREIVLTDLLDVDTETTLPVNGNILRWDVNTWKPFDLGLSDLLKDVNIGTPNLGQYLQHNGTKWINSALAFTVKKTSGTSTFNNINTLEFSNNFSISNTGTTAIIDYTGGSTGATTLLALNDVEDNYPSFAIDGIETGILVFNNKTSNTSNIKTFFATTTRIQNNNIAFNQDIQDIFLMKAGGDSGVLGVGSYLALTSMAVYFDPKPNGIYSLTMYKTGNDLLTNVAMTWSEPFIMANGTNITNATTPQQTTKLIFGSNLSGSYNPTTGELTINAISGGSSGIPYVTYADPSKPGTRPLIYDQGSSGIPAKIRGLTAGDNIEMEMRDNNSSITTNLNSAVFYILKSKMSVRDKSWGGGITTVSNPSSGSYDLQAYGIKGTGGISVTLDTDTTDPTRKNLLISGSGSSGGSGLVLGSYNLVSSSNQQGLGMSVNVNQAGFRCNGTPVLSTGIGFSGSDLDTGLSIEQSKTAVKLTTAHTRDHTLLSLDGSCKNPINFSSYGTVSSVSQLIGMDYGSLIYMNYTGSGGGDGLYFRISSGNLVKLSFTQIGPI